MTLGVRPSASPAEIRSAYTIRLRLLHPDRHQGAASEVVAAAEALTIALNEAYTALQDPARRAAYDAERSRSSPESFARPGAAGAPHVETQWQQALHSVQEVLQEEAARHGGVLREAHQELREVLLQCHERLLSSASPLEGSALAASVLGEVGTQLPESSREATFEVVARGWERLRAEVDPADQQALVAPPRLGAAPVAPLERGRRAERSLVRELTLLREEGAHVLSDIEIPPAGVRASYAVITPSGLHMLLVSELAGRVRVETQGRGDRLQAALSIGELDATALLGLAWETQAGMRSCLRDLPLPQERRDELPLTTTLVILRGRLFPRRQLTVGSVRVSAAEGALAPARERGVLPPEDVTVVTERLRALLGL